MALGITLDTHAKREDRANERHRLHLDVTGKTDSLDGFDGVLRDLSCSGFLLETTLALRSSDEIEISLPHAGPQYARVAWSSGRFHGCRFNQPITKASVSAALLRTPSRDQAAKPAADASGKDSFGIRLKRLREHLSISQAGFARALGVSKPTVWKWETDATFPRPKRLAEIAELLGISVVELEYGAEESGGPEADVPSTLRRGLEQVTRYCKTQIAECAGVDESQVEIVVKL